MSLLQINTAIPLAEPLLEQVEEPQDRRRDPPHGAKCMAWGAVTGFVIQLAAKQVGDEEEEDAAATTAAVFLTGFLPHAILVTVIVDLLLCYCTVRCSDTGDKKKTSNHSKNESSHPFSPRNDDEDDDNDEEVGCSSPPLNQHHTVVLRTVQDMLRLPMKMNNTVHVPVHASPPCQGFSSQNRNKTVHVPVHVSPPCQGFSSENRNKTVLHASTPWQGLSLSPQMNHTKVLHASPPCQGFSSSSK